MRNRITTFNHEAPAPFNPDARPGLHDAVSKAYAHYCETCPDQSTGPSLERSAEYARIYAALRPLYPSHSELHGTSTECRSRITGTGNRQEGLN